MNMPIGTANDSIAVTRAEFDAFLVAFTHDLRNRLNGIALEAADLAEQAGPRVDSSRIQRRVQECATYLKKVRDTLSPDDPEVEKIGLAEYVKRLRE